jgi:flagellar basal-body rod protein FlgG
MRSLSIAATGMLAQQTNVEVISNNLANLSTTGFKRQRAEFADLVYQDLRRKGVQSSETGTILPSGMQIGLGVRSASVYRIMEQGNLTKTNNTFDLAVQGRGYFQVEMPSGETAYTRAGAFLTNENGQVVTQEGYTVQPGITVPNNAQNVTVNASGEVLVSIPGQTDATNVGQLQLATFFNDAGLEAVGDNLFLQTAASGDPNTGNPDADNFGSVLQGYLEVSNVNAVQEITTLITAQRAYELNSKVITTSDELLQVTSNMK